MFRIKNMFGLAEAGLGNAVHNPVRELTTPCWAASSEPGLRGRTAIIHQSKKTAHVLKKQSPIYMFSNLRSLRRAGEVGVAQVPGGATDSAPRSLFGVEKYVPRAPPQSHSNRIGSSVLKLSS